MRLTSSIFKPLYNLADLSFLKPPNNWWRKWPAGEAKDPLGRRLEGWTSSCLHFASTRPCAWLGRTCRIANLDKAILVTLSWIVKLWVNSKWKLCYFMLLPGSVAYKCCSTTQFAGLVRWDDMRPPQYIYMRPVRKYRETSAVDWHLQPFQTLNRRETFIMNTESMNDLMSNPTRSDRFGDFLTFGQPDSDLSELPPWWIEHFGFVCGLFWKQSQRHFRRTMEWWGGFQWLGLINFELNCQVAGIGDFIFNSISEWHF